MSHSTTGTASLSRRKFLIGAAGTAGMAILAACGGSSSATNTAPPAATAAATRAPTTAAASGTAATAQATTASASAAATAAPNATTQASAGSAVAGTPAVALKPEKGKITVAVGGAEQFIYAPITLAKQLNYFKDMGLDVEIASFSGGAKAAEALIGGSADMVVGFYDHTIQTQPKGENLQLVILYDNFPGIVLEVSSKSADKIKAAADLKGQNVGITSAGSSTQFLLNYYLTKNGIQPDQVNVVAIGTGSTSIAAIQQNKVVAGMMVDPAATKVETTGDAKPLWDTRTEKDTVAQLGGPYPAGGVYSTADFIKKNPNTTQVIVTGSLMALKYIQTRSPEEIASKMPREYIGDDKQNYLDALKKDLPLFSTTGMMPEAGPQSVLNVLKLSDPVVKGASSIDLKATYTNQFVDVAAKQVK
jgi:NitT/TauT family transport system substrate-binding protein